VLGSHPAAPPPWEHGRRHQARSHNDPEERDDRQTGRDHQCGERDDDPCDHVYSQAATARRTMGRASSVLSCRVIIGGQAPSVHRRQFARHAWLAGSAVRGVGAHLQAEGEQSDPGAPDDGHEMIAHHQLLRRAATSARDEQHVTQKRHREWCDREFAPR
jgi:hypothetical protein